MEKILFLLCFFPLLLLGQNKNVLYTEGNDKGYVAESQLKIDANNIFNTSAFAQTINYWSKSGESYSLATSGIQRVLVDDRGVSLGVTNRYSRLNVLGGVNADSLIVGTYASFGGTKLQNIANGTALSDAANIGQISGTSGYITKFTSIGITASIIHDNGSAIGINTTTPSSGYKADINGAIRIRGTLEIPTNTDMTINAYYNSGWKYRIAGYSADWYQDGAGNFNFYTAPSGNADASISFIPAFQILNTGGSNSFGYRATNLGNPVAAQDAVTLSYYQNAANITTGTLADARISSNIARTADIKTATYTALTIPTQSTDYNLTFNWNSFNVHTYRVDGVNFTGTNILISGSSPVNGGDYVIIFRNCTGKNLVFSSKFLNFDDVALSTIVATASMRFKFRYDGTNYIRID